MDDEVAIEVALRWRDLDHQGHVYHATVLTLLDEARTRWLRDALGVAEPDSYVVARVAVDYVAEIARSDERILVAFGLERVGTTSLTTRETVRAPDGRVLATAGVVVVLWDRDSGAPRALLAEERDRAVGCLDHTPS